MYSVVKRVGSVAIKFNKEQITELMCESCMRDYTAKMLQKMCVPTGLKILAKPPLGYWHDDAGFVQRLLKYATWQTASDHEKAVTCIRQNKSFLTLMKRFGLDVEITEATPLDV